MKKIVYYLTVSLVITVLIGLVIIPFAVMKPMIGQHWNFSQVWRAEEYDLSSRTFFVETDDGLYLYVYEVAVERPKAAIICLSGIQNPSVTAYFGHARMFADHGYATFMLDMRAHGESEGERICVGYKEYLDVKAVLQHIKSDSLYKNVPVVVMGVSMGGATAINAFGELPEIDGLISLSAYSSWEEVFYEQMVQTVPKFFASIEKPFIYLASMVKFGGKSCLVKPIKEVKKIGGRPAILMHSLDDSQVPYANFERLWKKAPASVETFVREGDKHFVSNHFTHPEEDLEYAEALMGFLRTYF